jgi:hypothetical protein
MYAKLKIGLRWRGHSVLGIENDMVPNASGADCHDVLSRLLFSESPPSACILLTLKKKRKEKNMCQVKHLALFSFY